MLKIKNLHVKVQDKDILKGVSLEIKKGEKAALMGPNGSGKSTLAGVLMGNPSFEIVSGKIFYNEKDITNLKPNERSNKGIFLSFQNPEEVEGVKLFNFLRESLNSNLKEKDKLSPIEFNLLIREKMNILNLNESYLQRYLNEGFSGGEKKISEILQLLILNPSLAILDEPDSGLDIDALKRVASGINSFFNRDKAFFIITHYKRILEFVKPDKLFVMIDGKIVLEGEGNLINKLEEKGYGWIEKE